MNQRTIIKMMKRQTSHEMGPILIESEFLSVRIIQSGPKRDQLGRIQLLGLRCGVKPVTV